MIKQLTNQFASIFSVYRIDHKHSMCTISRLNMKFVPSESLGGRVSIPSLGPAPGSPASRLDSHWPVPSDSVAPQSGQERGSRRTASSSSATSGSRTERLPGKSWPVTCVLACVQTMRVLRLRGCAPRQPTWRRPTRSKPRAPSYPQS